MAQRTPQLAEQRRLAVLIDADNAQAASISGLLAEVAKYGSASVRRIYGDFTSPRLNRWKETLLEHSIQPIQQFAYTSGKNATDSSMIIDAMDLLHTGRFDGFCLVSSDSDFTRLAQRIREEGVVVYGFGEEKTPGAFVQACDKFIYTEVLRRRPESAARANGSGAPQAAASQTPGSTKSTQGLDDLLAQAVEEASDDDGWAPLSAVGSYLSKLRPDFDPRLFGSKKLSDLVRQQGRLLQVEERGSGSARHIYVRLQA